MKSSWSPRATEHLLSALDYWADRSSEDAAMLMLERVMKAIEMLQDFPSAGRPGRVEGTRELIIRPMPYVVVYRVREQHIEIISFLHTSRRWPDRF